MRRLRSLIVLALAVFLGAACSFTRLAYMSTSLAYGNATPVLAWMAADYVDMSGDQKDWVRDRLTRAMAWHRAQELPEYRRFLEEHRFEGQCSLHTLVESRSYATFSRKTCAS